MSFGAPTALYWLALAAPIIGLYILKVRLRRVPVSTNLFWKQLYDEKPPRSIWQYLRHLLSLLLQLLLLALLVAAVANPFFAWQLREARRVVLVVDRSASMQARDVAPTRFAAAIAAGHELVAGLRDRDELAIVLAGDPPQTVMGMTGHVPTLRRSLAALHPGDGPTDLDPAIALARRLIGDHPHGEVVVLTDGCVEAKPAPDEVAAEAIVAAATNPPPPPVDSGDDAAAQSDDAPLVVYRRFATDAANVGITQFQVRRSLIDPLGYEVLTQVKNASATPVDCRLEIELDGLPVDILPLPLAAEETWTRSIEKTSLDGGRLSARLTQVREQAAADSGQPSAVSHANATTKAATDAQPSTLDTQHSTLNSLPTDDVAWALLPPREIQRVLLVTPGNLFLQKVFEANPLVSLEVVKELPAEWPADVIVVLHQLVPATLPPGDLFVVDPGGSTDAWTLGEPLANPIVTEQDRDSPLMTHVRLDNVLMPQAHQLTAATPSRVLAGCVSGDPIYVELQRPLGRCLVLTVNLDAGDLAFRTAFPIMVSNALGWFAGTSGELRRSVSTGDVAEVTVEAPPTGNVDAVQLVRPDGTRQSLAVPERDAPADGSAAEEPAALVFGPLDHVGVYEVVRASGTQTGGDGAAADGLPPLAAVAVNLANARESDLRPPKDAVDGRQAAAVGAWFTRPLWFYLAAAACLLTVTEWCLYHRRFVD